MIPRTKVQADCLAAIRLLTVNGIPPTLAEIGMEIGYASKGAVHRLLTTMKERGLIDWNPGVTRSLRIVETADVLEGLTVPELLTLRGRIEARLVEQAVAR